MSMLNVFLIILCFTDFLQNLMWVHIYWCLQWKTTMPIFMGIKQKILIFEVELKFFIASVEYRYTRILLPVRCHLNSFKEARQNNGDLGEFWCLIDKLMNKTADKVSWFVYSGHCSSLETLGKGESESWKSNVLQKL